MGIFEWLNTPSFFYHTKTTSMKYLLSISLLLLFFQGTAQYKTDSVAIVNLLKDDYKTMGTWNIEQHIKNCTTNYLLIEEGEVWDMQKESKYYKTNSHRKINRKDYFDIKHVRIYGNTAYAVYSLKSDISENGQLTIRNWKESAIFRKLNGRWLIELIHSTPVSTAQ